MEHLVTDQPLDLIHPDGRQYLVTIRHDDGMISSLHIMATDATDAAKRACICVAPVSLVIVSSTDWADTII